jgi:hypothetical protein
MIPTSLAPLLVPSLVPTPPPPSWVVHKDVWAFQAIRWVLWRFLVMPKGYGTYVRRPLGGGAGERELLGGVLLGGEQGGEETGGAPSAPDGRPPAPLPPLKPRPTPPVKPPGQTPPRLPPDRGVLHRRRRRVCVAAADRLRRGGAQEGRLHRGRMAVAVGRQGRGLGAGLWEEGAAGAGLRGAAPRRRFPAPCARRHSPGPASHTWLTPNPLNPPGWCSSCR